ncbi:LysR family transcriptional regulator [Litoreibacter roseus]|uniref:LysR family transcriptional regulator n=1 Tax=Litoreibacter roseus TaxID=2601869 RepID=A0A6N6JL54_9RHOB|nr:LysR family transcriptional regulator [Litoreibacter roseus]GFE67046.1 LysR family transcriptional regulator [Litoreibacter roseus]
MDLRQIKCFISVAEELHFRRAAERVGLAQTALSAQVKRLEDELGFALLFRTTRHVSLTQAGAVFLEECRAVLDRLDAAVDRAGAAALSGLDRLRIGGIDAALVWLLPPIFAAFQKQHPGIRLNLTEVTGSLAQLDELSRHRIDLCFFRPPVQRDGIEWEALYEERMMVAVTATSPLAARSCVSPGDLLDERLIGYPRHSRAYLASMVEACFRDVSAMPPIDLEVLDKSTLLRLVGQGAGIGLVPQWVSELGSPDVQFLELRDSPVLQFGVAWRERDGSSQTLTDFLDLVRAQASDVRTRFAPQSQSAAKT